MKNPDILHSLRHALDGIKESVRAERNLRIDLIFAAAAMLMAALLRLSVGEWAILMLTIALVLALELMNTALEELADEVTEAERPRIRRAKDTAAGAVTAAALGAVIVGVLLFGPRLWALLF